MHDVMCIDPVFCTNYEKNHTQRIVATTRCGKETVPACFYFERGLSTEAQPVIGRNRTGEAIGRWGSRLVMVSIH